MLCATEAAGANLLRSKDCGYMYSKLRSYTILPSSYAALRLHTSYYGGKREAAVLPPTLR
jgi:hypothetical protein